MSSNGICESKIKSTTKSHPPEYCFDGKKLTLSEDTWKKRLTPEQFRILREAGTEPPFKNAYNDNKAYGIYLCAGCELPLFASTSKFDSGTGWPSFSVPICAENVTLNISGFFRQTTEVRCARCDGHLGDLFKDGPAPSNNRFCINSESLRFTTKQ